MRKFETISKLAQFHTILFLVIMTIFVSCSGTGNTEKKVLGSGNSENVLTSNLSIKFVSTPTFEGDYNLRLVITNEASEVVYEALQAVTYSLSETTLTFDAELVYGPYTFLMTLENLVPSIVASDSIIVTVNQPTMELSFRLNFDSVAEWITIELASEVSIIATINHPPVITLNEAGFNVNFNESNFAITLTGDTLQINDPETGDMCQNAFLVPNTYFSFEAYEETDTFISMWLGCVDTSSFGRTITNAQFEYVPETNCQFTITVPNALEYFAFESAVTVAEDISNFERCSLSISAFDQSADAYLATTFNLP